MEGMLHNSYVAHGYCLMWKPWLVGLHGLSDLLTALAYFAIPVAIFIFVKRRGDLEMKNLAWMFVAFITLCGLTHVVGLITLWAPIYETEGWVKGATAVVSVVTAIAIFPLIPKALAIPSPSQLQLVNGQLTDEIEAHKRTLADLEAARMELERRVEERTQALNESQTFLKSITDIAPTMLYVYDIQNQRNDWMNRNVIVTLGYQPEELRAMGDGMLSSLMHPDDFARYRAHQENQITLAPEETIEFEYRLRSADGEWIWLLSQEMAYTRSADGTVTHIIGAAHDITLRKEQEERIHLLMAEVNHRARNLLTVVQSVARQTSRLSDPATFAEDLSNRLAGLAASQDLIIQGEWQGVRMRDLVTSQLGHLGDSQLSRLVLDGESITVSPAAAQGIGMALHELSTNALKYGAFSNETGTVHIVWTVKMIQESAMFIISWQERDGPAVKAPEKTGFGRTVIERMAGHAVSGEVDLHYDPDGLKWSLSAPLDKVLNRTEQTGRS
ncbi:sensor histidine kinase [Aquisalinus flavus]|uniref:histidine kinase n=1 Tax=Aquisalinus flavus TaxID=1526572 RepID=A0A8J2Y680_9PROT|nr:HWE histidine kinase domain-containing protein [Aquisalinus flavus]MBD0426592.1 PAS domain S-box protein [Aquisalinus flavus]UNE47862.1 PAS domain S-box protein [Aquisalinus flavus]GGD06692.1 histidine kinase [Aquisalinus flavus]